MKTLGEKLKYHRESNGYSQSFIAKATGISQQKISYYESGKHSPSIVDCIKLADFTVFLLMNWWAEKYKQINNKPF